MRPLLLVSLCVFSCFAFTQVEQQVIDAMKQAQANIDANAVDQKETTDTQSQKASPESAAEQKKGELLLETTKILMDKYGAEYVSQLANLDVDSLMAAAFPTAAPSSSK